MTVSVVGEVTLMAALPAVATPVLSISARLEAELAALLNFSVTPPSIQLDLDVAAELVAGLQLALSLGVTPPGIDAQIEATLALIADLKIQLGLFHTLLGTLAASAHVYAVDSTVGAIGTELQGELAGGLPGGSGSDPALAVVFVATAPAAVAALLSLFKTSP